MTAPVSLRPPVPVAGIDAAKVRSRPGWLGVLLTPEGNLRTLLEVELRHLLQQLPEGAIVGIDIPLECSPGALRRCDELGRQRLGARHSTLYPVPPLEVLLEPDHARASALSRELTGKGISRQSHGLRHRILEARSLRGESSLHEVHPELSFLELTGASSLAPKKTWRGQGERLQALARAGIELPAEVPLGDQVQPDDLLDATVAAWTAARIARGEAHSLPSSPAREEPVIWI